MPVYRWPDKNKFRVIFTNLAGQPTPCIAVAVDRLGAADCWGKRRINEPDTSILPIAVEVANGSLPKARSRRP